MKHRFLIFLLSLFSVTASLSAGSFEIGERSFRLNGAPFLIKAAEVHYTRIPRPYWAHRIAMCKAMGMNTLCIYVFWNIHEQKEGVFDFTGENDIRAFCKEAQRQGMYIIVRPGPYVCSEWEMGGLPWWLLKKPDMELRSNHPYFIERTRLYLQKVGEQLSDLQITRGGNILMVQVENEFGSYNTDKEYVSKIRDLVRASGFTDVPLFQCDWSYNFINNGLDDLLWTLNFGAGANIDQQFSLLKQVRPQTPLMCSEYWSGWFDHWGRKHETREASVLVEGLGEMMEKQISFSLYMTHGGTTFGQWGGANSPAYSAMCTSYDYDAPISESGRATPKYYQLRALLTRDEDTVPVPRAMPLIAIDEIRLQKASPLLGALKGGIFSDTIASMEQFDQGWGTILYRTQLPRVESSETRLVIDQLHDWGQIWLNGEKLATLDRRRGENSVLLPLGASGTLDILVEAMGRVNFDKAIHDRKGITHSVKVTTGKNSTQLKGWHVFLFPTDCDFVQKRSYSEIKSPIDEPAYYKGSFSLKKTGDTFLDMRGWGKGFVWVNGHNLGRYWHIGPQQTLYLPGCWLKKGKNEIIVLDLENRPSGCLSGLTTPILDELHAASILNRKPGEKISLNADQLLSEGQLKEENGWQTVLFDSPRDIAYFAIEALSVYGESSVAAIAELQLINAQGTDIPRQEWRIQYADSEETQQINGTADKVFDLQESTYWITQYTGGKNAFPHCIALDLGASYPVKGFRYLPRAEKNAVGMIKEYRIYGSEHPFVLIPE